MLKTLMSGWHHTRERLRAGSVRSPFGIRRRGDSGLTPPPLVEDGDARECRGDRHSRSSAWPCWPCWCLCCWQQGRRLDRVEARIERIEDTLHALAERVARIEGALTGPWRPTNGSPAAAAPKGSPPEATAG